VDVEVVHISSDLTRLSDALHLELKPIDTLGILAVEIDAVIGALMPSLRIPSGLIVAARTEHWRDRRFQSRRGCHSCDQRDGHTQC